MYYKNRLNNTASSTIKARSGAGSHGPMGASNSLVGNITAGSALSKNIKKKLNYYNKITKVTVLRRNAMLSRGIG